MGGSWSSSDGRLERAQADWAAHGRSGHRIDRWLANVVRQPGLFAELKVRAAAGEYEPWVAVQIDKDLHRTLLDLPGVEERQAVWQASLRTVLLAYSIINPEVAYCQGLNALAGAALLRGVAGHFPPTEQDEECAFWWLSHAVSSVLPPGACLPGLHGLLVEQAVLAALHTQAAPAAAARLDDLGVSMGLCTTSWFLCAFTQALPASTALEALDLLALGELAAVQLALAILLEASAALEVATVATEVMAALAAACAAPGLLSRACAAPLRRARLEALRCTEAAALVEQQRDMAVRRELLEVRRATRFDAATVELLHRHFCSMTRTAASGGHGGTWPPAGSARHSERASLRELERDEPAAVDLPMFTKICKQVTKGELDASFATQLFAAADHGGRGKLEFPELIAALSVVCRGTAEERATLCFRAWDVGQRGYLEIAEVATMLQHLADLHHADLRASISQSLRATSAGAADEAACRGGRHTAGAASPVFCSGSSALWASAAPPRGAGGAFAGGGGSLPTSPVLRPLRPATPRPGSPLPAAAARTMAAARGRLGSRGLLASVSDGQHARSIFALFDRDGDGRINLEEFLQAVAAEPRIVTWCLPDQRSAAAASARGGGAPRAAPPRWMADASSDFCPRCGGRFWLLRRRHHCRGCGEIFCDACSAARSAASA